ncbi:MAG TPA: gfo/Idh/MocA family oxidoreductase, partial [Pseudolysinimonas sp.]|nr:gfo/Idh/MocA family oxidoreductase [Pseudolysinimonas sp.]
HTVSLDGDVLFRNPYVGHRVSDEDIAAAALLDAMAQHVRSQGPAPYPLADGSQDHILALAIDESLRTGGPIVVHPQPWASALAQ